MKLPANSMQMLSNGHGFELQAGGVVVAGALVSVLGSVGVVLSGVMLVPDWLVAWVPELTVTSGFGELLGEGASVLVPGDPSPVVVAVGLDAEVTVLLWASVVESIIGVLELPWTGEVVVSLGLGVFCVSCDFWVVAVGSVADGAVLLWAVVVIIGVLELSWTGILVTSLGVAVVCVLCVTVGSVEDVRELSWTEEVVVSLGVGVVGVSIGFWVLLSVVSAERITDVVGGLSVVLSLTDEVGSTKHVATSQQKKISL